MKLKWSSAKRTLFHDLDLLGRQAVEPVHKLVDLRIRRRNLPLKPLLLTRRLRPRNASRLRKV